MHIVLKLLYLVKYFCLNIVDNKKYCFWLKKTKYNQLHIILAFIKGKKINELISRLPPNSNIYFTSINMERGMDYSEIIQNVGRSIIFDENPKRLLDTVKGRCSYQDIILITGSNFIAKSIL